MQHLDLKTIIKKGSGGKVDERGYWAYVRLFPPPGSEML